MTFNADLQLGKKYEDIAISMLVDETVIDKPEGLCKEYDFKTNKSIYEVKCDRLSYKTGNLFIEFQCSNKPSGIMSTTADYWYYFVILPLSLTTYPANHRAYKIPTAYIKDIIKENPRTIFGGDGYRSKGYLIPESRFKDYLIFQNGAQ